MDFSHSALLLAAHGSSTDPQASAPTYQLAEQLRARAGFAEVAVAFYREAPLLRDALAQLQSSTVYIVPNFISRGYFTRTVLPREFALEGRVTRSQGKTVHYCEPVGTHPLMTEALLVAADAAVAAATPDLMQTSLLIAGHGTLRNRESAAVIREQAGKITQLRRYAECLAVFMEEAPQVRDWAELTTQPNVIVVPFLIAAGPHFSVDLPQMLGLNDLPASWPVTVRGKRLWYGRPLAGNQQLVDMVLEIVTWTAQPIRPS